jgi:hypothetical protein
MARNEHVVLRSATIACLVVVYMQVMVYRMGGVINLGKPDIEPPESATIWASITSGLPNPKTKKADPQRESAFNFGSGGVICSVPTVANRIRLK